MDTWLKGARFAGTEAEILLYWGHALGLQPSSSMVDLQSPSTARKFLDPARNLASEYYRLNEICGLSKLINMCFAGI